MPSYLPSMVTLTAGAFVLISVYLYRRKYRERTTPSTSTKDTLEGDVYQPVTVIENYDIFVIDSSSEHRLAVESFAEAAKLLKVIGLDCEWVTKDGQRQPVALLQISSPVNQSCLLFRLDQLGGKLPESIGKILEDRNTLKVGVGVIDDAKRLLTDYQIITHGCLDLRHLALRHLARTLRGRSLSLRELASIVLQHEMSKNDRVRCGNWEAVPLSKEQINYAAEDAVIGAAIFLKIVAYKMKLKHFESFFQLEIWKSISSMCQGIVDMYPDMKQLTNTNSSSKKPEKHSKGVCIKSKERPLSRAYKTRKSVMYHNCRLLAPDDTLLCTCDKRKALWYVSKEIGEIICEEPLTVRLLFEPSGVPGPDREYYQIEKKNMCVVCGWEDSYIKKHVVPHEYRRHFPQYLKMHSSHDVLLLCLKCHQRSGAHDNILRQEISIQYNAPLSNRTNAKRLEDPQRVQLRSVARALIRHKNANNLPEQRVQELTDHLREFFGVDEIDDSLLQKGVSIETKVTNENYLGSHGLKVVEELMKKEDGLTKFEKLWRQNFLDTMEPQYLPELWSVDHLHEASVCKK
ncbi:exonuclease 3'-5' domain-containing protein 2-like [Lytechinus pictus]|uniref:exonuclease 3'-5' domain-containing protein 2-like n=1 Tax=Lytechinus pictus TaxID=7653 RepID=UPI0030B9BD81